MELVSERISQSDKSEAIESRNKNSVDDVVVTTASVGSARPVSISRRFAEDSPSK